MAQEPSDRDRKTTAQGLFVYADAYLRSAEMLAESADKPPHWQAPVRFLAYHAIELYLKAILRACGESLSDVERRRHDLRRLLESASRHQLTVPQPAMDVLAIAQDTGDVIESRYIVTGTRRIWVETDELIGAAQQIREAVVDHPRRAGEIVLHGEALLRSVNWASPEL